MNYFVETKERSPNHLRIHPLFLSLTAAFTKSAKSPDIGSVSENDPRVLNNQYYTSSSDLPPLDIHFPGQNSRPHLSEICGVLLSFSGRPLSRMYGF
jgi:hypothetical protein